VPILRAIIEVPNEVLVVYDDPDDACVPVIERLRERFPSLRAGFATTSRAGSCPRSGSASLRHVGSMCNQ
jgi:hypothetical protein